ncbi:CPBP family intramembrane glutamic endopeptidase [Aridibaculum aurantiacum]|uniref:CPBP family intramembrane glutamic endopeptidase n=1 Tax=Aridibaculum aurantiacum TaxID=2810307 RepID=UPI001A959ECF|nr:CPBP family intramembrane glutamic endopeptidase [Aridibaculum aurantiacum]
MKDVKFIAGFIFLNLYLRLLPSLFNGNDVLWLITFISFFPLTHLIAKWSSSIGLKKLGFCRTKHWKNHLFLGLVVGGATWILLTVAELSLGSLQFIKWQEAGAVYWLIIQALVVAVLGSATNDLLTRGYVVGHFKNRLPAFAIILLSTVIYIADDIWLEGWSIRNILFSFLLGLAFAISVIRLQSLWMNTGIHAGLNFIYYLVYGFGNDPIHHGVFVSTTQPNKLSPYLGLLAALTVLVVTIFLTRNIAVKKEDYRQKLDNLLKV